MPPEQAPKFEPVAEAPEQKKVATPEERSQASKDAAGRIASRTTEDAHMRSERLAALRAEILNKTPASEGAMARVADLMVARQKRDAESAAKVQARLVEKFGEQDPVAEQKAKYTELQSQIDAARAEMSAAVSAAENVSGGAAASRAKFEGSINSLLKEQRVLYQTMERSIKDYTRRGMSSPMTLEELAAMRGPATTIETVQAAQHTNEEKRSEEVVRGAEDQQEAALEQQRKLLRNERRAQLGLPPLP